MVTAYPDAVRLLQAAIEEYRQKRLSLPGLQAAVWSAAESVQAFDERELRQFLETAEGRLDMIRFTTNATDVFAASMKLVSTIENRLREALNN